MSNMTCFMSKIVHKYQKIIWMEIKLEDKDLNEKYQEDGDPIAEGASAEVFKVIETSSNKVFAKKKVRFEDKL